MKEGVAMRIILVTVINNMDYITGYEVYTENGNTEVYLLDTVPNSVIAWINNAKYFNKAYTETGYETYFYNDESVKY